MSANITKFVLRSTQPDGVGEYIRDLSIPVEQTEDADILDQLRVDDNNDQSSCIYLIEIAAGQSYQCSEPSLRLNNPDEASSTSEYNGDVINYITKFFREKLDVPESIFEDHIARGPKFRFNEDFQTPRAPTSLHADVSFMLRYYELVSYTGDPSSLTSLPEQDDSCLSCASTGRQIQCHQWHASRIKEGMLLIVPRKCSYWQRKDKRGCNTVILCDPRTSMAELRGQNPISVEPHVPFNGGYPDFIALSEHVWKSDGASRECKPPPRTSFADDFAHYLKFYSSQIDESATQLSISLLIKKLVAAHYSPLIGFVTFQISSMRSRGWALKRTTQTEKDAAAMVETDWSRFRCTEYLEDMEANLDALGIRRFDCKEHAGMDGWLAWQVEFHWIYQQLNQRRVDYDRLTTSMAALAGIIGTRQALEETRLQKEETVRALREAKSMKTLTVIAMAFAPLTWTSGLFNMSDPFVPGGSKFWVYFAVALPATVVVFLITLLANRGYNRKAEWTMQTFCKSFHDVLNRKKAASTASSDEKSIAGST